MTISKELLLSSLEPYGIELNDTALDRFDKYAELLLYWNERINLTAITDADSVVTKHFTDSLTVMHYQTFQDTDRMIDVGTGAGFPAIPLLIANPRLNMTLLDSTGKKITFIETVLDALELKAETRNARAEELGKNETYREQYDFCIARAVANLRDLCEYCLPFVRLNGTFISMKGAKATEELADAEKAIKVLGGKLERTDTFDLPGCGQRNIIFIRKFSQTPTKYPRISAQIKKHPII